jgi:hypothetical protein
MTPEDLDRILGSEEPLVPSAGFAASVVERALEAASAPPPLPFPWRRYLLGLLVILAMSGICGGLAARVAGIEVLGAAVHNALAVFADPRLSLPLGEAAASLLGTYVLIRLTLGPAGALRR